MANDLRRFIDGVKRQTGDLLVMAVCIALTMAVATLVYRMVERPMST